MNLPRRQFVHLVAGAAAVSAIPVFALAFDYPTRPIHIIAGFPAASATDVVARLIAQSLSERLDQQVVVEDKPGAGSNIAAQTVVQAAPDGYTLLAMTITNTVNATLYQDLNFDITRVLRQSYLPSSRRL
jgi:tripartite-type tricarboxylate transporter receptor subunit TctC